MMENGANSVRAVCTHAILSGNAYERIEESVLKELIVTDTIPLKKESEKIKVLSVAHIFSDVVRKVVSCESISSTFIC
jgi:ribose-phosphate pyrophosphokinase